jgi:hypothetical protein
MNIECKYCKKTYDIPITEEDYQKWLSTPSGDVRDAADYLEAWQREMLISQTCDNCWKRMFGKSDCEVYYT